MKRLVVLFDGECALCGRCRDWLARQPAFLELEFIPFQSPEARERFPGIEALHPVSALDRNRYRKLSGGLSKLK